MATSGTYTFSPSLGELTLYAFNLVGVRNTAILQEHLESARMATNLMLASWSNRGVNLWKVDLVTTPLVTGQSTYSVDASTVMILDAYISTDNGSAITDRIILPVSRTEYANYPNKNQEGFPTVFWFDRLLSPTVTIWPVPNVDTTTQSLKYYRVRRIEDAEFSGGQNVDMPYLWMDAFANGLAYRLAVIWATEKIQILKPLADEAYQIAADQNVETSNFYISPSLSGYWRP